MSTPVSIHMKVSLSLCDQELAATLASLPQLNMSFPVLALVFLFVQLLPALSDADSPVITDDRRVWSVCNASSVDNGTDTTTTCQCGRDPSDTVECSKDGNFLTIQPCYCLFYDVSENATLVGNCMVSCYNAGHKYVHPLTRYPVENGSLFNEEVCGK